MNKSKELSKVLRKALKNSSLLEAKCELVQQSCRVTEPNGRSRLCILEEGNEYSFKNPQVR